MIAAFGIVLMIALTAVIGYLKESKYDVLIYLYGSI